MQHWFRWLDVKQATSQYLNHWWPSLLTHIVYGTWGRWVISIIIGPGKGLAPVSRQAITRTNNGRLSIGSLGTNLNINLIEIQLSSLKKILRKMSSAKWLPFYLGLCVLLHSVGQEVYLNGLKFVLACVKYYEPLSRWIFYLESKNKHYDWERMLQP